MTRQEKWPWLFVDGATAIGGLYSNKIEGGKFVLIAVDFVSEKAWLARHGGGGTQVWPLNKADNVFSYVE